MTDDIVIKVENLSKVYKLYDKPIDRMKESLNILKKSYHKEFFALENVTFEIRKGESVGLVGKNGSGKSTLLKIITGVLTPTAGNVYAKGKVSALLELGAGFNQEYTGMQNIYLNATMMGYSKEEIETKVPSIIEFADIGDFINQPVKTYSSGMFVRLAFAVAINVEPDILIVDEALAVGDMYFQAKCMSKMNEIMRKGTTILFVTHDINSIKVLCDRCIFLKSGKIHSIGEAGATSDLYIKDLREESLQRGQSNLNISLLGEKVIKSNALETKGELKFIENHEFLERTKLFKHGSGEALIKNVELLDDSGNMLTSVKFDQQVRIRVHVEFKEQIEAVIGYFVRDDKNIEIMGSTTRFEGIGIIDINSGQRLIVDFITHLPLKDGIYNITVQVSKPIIPNQIAHYFDYIENTIVFEVLQREKIRFSPAKVYIDHKVELYRDELISDGDA
jgi:ABC-type polysaccharide/polyol phosphate transport system ATPase subunit